MKPKRSFFTSDLSSSHSAEHSVLTVETLRRAAAANQSQICNPPPPPPQYIISSSQMRRYEALCAKYPDEEPIDVFHRRVMEWFFEPQKSDNNESAT